MSCLLKLEMDCWDLMLSGSLVHYTSAAVKKTMPANGLSNICQ